MRKTSLVFLFSLICLFIFNTHRALAANTTIATIPNSGSFDKPFTVSLIIDGQGEKFNAAQATVDISSNLKIQDLVLGDCNFSFIRTPSTQNPSFAGVILSSYATKCTVYSLTLVPVTKGTASVTLSDESLRRYGDAEKVPVSIQNGTYRLTATSKVFSAISTKPISTPASGLYTLLLKIIASDKEAVSKDIVILSPVSKKNQQQATTDTNGIAHFSNLQPGVYDASVKEGNHKVGETIINVSGSNHVLTLGINLDTQKNNPLMKDSHSILNKLTNSPIIIGGVMLVGILVGTGIALSVVKLNGRKKK